MAWNFNTAYSIYHLTKLLVTDETSVIIRDNQEVRSSNPHQNTEKKILFLIIFFIIQNYNIAVGNYLPPKYIH